MTKKRSHGAKKVLLAGALAAGTYFLAGKDGAKNRKKVKAWALSAKKQVEKGMEVGMKNAHIIKKIAEKEIKEAKSGVEKIKNGVEKEVKGRVKKMKKIAKK